MIEENIFKTIGALGLILISVGLLIGDRKKQNILYILGGIGLEIYSISTRDMIFIVLEIVFILSAVYNFLKLSK